MHLSDSIEDGLSSPLRVAGNLNELAHIEERMYGGLSMLHQCLQVLYSLGVVSTPAIGMWAVVAVRVAVFF